MSNEGIIQGAKLNEPVPRATKLQQDRHGVECGSRFRSTVVRETINFPQHINIPKGVHSRNSFQAGEKREPLCFSSFSAEMEKVPVPRVVNREEQPKDPVAVSTTSGYVVSERWRVMRAVTDRGRERLRGESRERVE